MVGFWQKSPTYLTAAVPSNVRVYAIGDLHGQWKLLAELVERIEHDCHIRGHAEVHFVFLGDFIDRGAGSADMLFRFCGTRSRHITVILGNHEAALIDAYEGDVEAMRGWLTFGGAETLLSLGIDEADIDHDDADRMIERLRSKVPVEVIDTLRRLPLTYQIGDYLFVHAGIRPGVSLAKQKRHDLLWIRDSFINSKRDHGVIVVHGHTFVEDVVLNAGRIGLDTHAYETGRLVALGLEGTNQWIVEVNRPDLIV